MSLNLAANGAKQGRVNQVRDDAMFVPIAMDVFRFIYLSQV